MLIQLPNGTWVDPEMVRSIQARGDNDGFSPSILVLYDDAQCCMFCQTWEDACHVRDTLAATINEAEGRSKA
jgi:hypothetical protein